MLLKTLTSDAFAGKTKPPLLACSGNPTDNLPALREAGFKVLALWHVTCKNIALKTQDRDQAGYWEERWELYRWMYLGGRFLASNDINDIELYNEPNIDPCVISESWLDEVRVRSVALQDAYADHSSWSQRSIKPTLIVPPMSAPVFEGGRGTPSYGRLAVQDVHTKFPSLENDPNWWNGVEYSYHQYNCTFSTFDAISTEVFTHSHTPTYAAPGYGMRSAWDKVTPQIRAASNRELPIRISEHNAYSNSNAEEAVGRDVMNEGTGAALFAGQIIAMADRAFFMSANKFSQTYSTSSSGVIKNGLLWGDLGHNEGGRGFCALGGITKSGEAYRLLLKRIGGGKPIYASTTSPDLPNVSNITYVAVSDSQAYYIYLSNAGPSTSSVRLNLAQWSDVPASAAVVVSGVSPTLHGEVACMPSLSPKRSLKIRLGGSSVLMATVPRVALSRTSTLLDPIGDTFVAAGDQSDTIVGASSPQLRVQTSSSSDQSLTSVAYVKFSLSGIDRSKIVSAVLRLTQTGVSGGSQQVLTVLGTTASWDESSLTWSNAPGLVAQPNGSGVKSIADNFIDYQSSVLVGHVTAGVPAQPHLALDVGDYLRDGGDPSFALVRMHRFDARGSGEAQLPADELGGPVTVSARESASTGKPVLRLVLAA